MADPGAGPASSLADLLGDLDARPHKVLPWPGQPARSVALWCLTAYEETLARKLAYEWVRTRLGMTEVDISYDQQRAITEEIAVRTLAVALRRADAPGTALDTAEELRTRLTSEQLAALLGEYTTYVRESSPFTTAENLRREVEELVSLAGKGYPLGTRLSYYDTGSLRGLLLTALDELATSRTDSSSASSPPSASTPPY
jgi:hypothetical protein